MISWDLRLVLNAIANEINGGLVLQRTHQPRNRERGILVHIHRLIEDDYTHIAIRKGRKTIATSIGVFRTAVFRVRVRYYFYGTTPRPAIGL